MTYMEEVLKHFNIEEGKPVGTSIDVNWMRNLKMCKEK